MGFNKALLHVGGQPLIRVLTDRVRPVTEHIFISSNDASSYQFLEFPVIPDHFRDHGPLAGFHAAMIRHVCSLYIVLACDLPNLQTQLLHRLISFADGFDAVIPRTADGMAHPLCSVYRRTCLPSIERALFNGANKVVLTFLDDSLAIKWLSPEEGRFTNIDLANVNNPEDLRRLGISAPPASAPDSIYSS
jgi:molybdopterin-guanine dinucleotide biosynthesis protein A